ncbi:MAG: YtxH domain-containing protein [Armatimonadetes bacterium]|jgi:gas vesicle protein|nr:YtxH domain-containing protein [Armatimonadota bacterium]
MRRFGFAVGMLFGAAAGLFLAPRRGAETRRAIRAVGGELADLVATPFTELATAVGTSLRQRGVRPATLGSCEPTL